MATQINNKELDLQEQLSRIRRMMEEGDRDRAETRKLIRESEKLNTDTRYAPATLLFQGLIATAALLGAGAALTKLFFP